SRRFKSSKGLRAVLSASGAVLKDGMTGRSFPNKAIVPQLCRNTTSASMALLGDVGSARNGLPPSVRPFTSPVNDNRANTDLSTTYAAPKGLLRVTAIRLTMPPHGAYIRL